MIKKNALIIFIKTPLPGLVKTRLQPDLTDVQSAELYSAFLKDLNKKFYNQDYFHLWYGVSPENYDQSILDRLFHLDNKFLQDGGDLGIRMDRAFQFLFEEGYEKIVLIGSDLPTITTDIISQTIHGLETKDCIIGPSKDGGYYLIALSRPHSEVFQDLPWSTSEVLEKTIEILDNKGLSYSLLPELEDIDTIKELISFYKALKNIDKSDSDFPIHSWSVASKIIDKR